MCALVAGVQTLGRPIWLTPRRDGDGRHRVELPARDLLENLAAPAPVLNRPLDQDQQLVDGGKGAQAMTDDHDGRAHGLEIADSAVQQCVAFRVQIGIRLVQHDKLGVPVKRARQSDPLRSEEHTSELQSLMRISYAVFCLKKKNKK